MVELTPERIIELSKTRNGFYSWDYVAALAAWIIGVEAENERLIVALGQLYEACMCADIEGELSELINGEILDAAQQALNEVKE